MVICFYDKPVPFSMKYRDLMNLALITLRLIEVPAQLNQKIISFNNPPNVERSQMKLAS